MLIFFAPMVLYFFFQRVVEPSKNGVLILSDLVFYLLAIAGLGYASHRSRRISKRAFLGWLLLAIYAFFLWAADFLWLFPQININIFDICSFADILFSVAYLFFLAAMVDFATQKFSRIEWVKRAIDVCIILVSLFLGFLIFLFKPIMLAGGTTDYQRNILLLLYPFTDMILLFSILAVIYFKPKQIIVTPFWIIFISVGIMCITDYFFSLSMVGGTYQDKNFLNVGWWYSCLFLGYAGFVQARYAENYPVSYKPAGKINPIIKRISPWLKYFPYLMVIAAYILFINFYSSPLAVSNELMVGLGVVVGLVIFRQVIVVYENKSLLDSLTLAMSQLKIQTRDLYRTNQDLLSEIERNTEIQVKLSYDAMHDALTGLSNRVLFTNRLEHAFEKNKRSAELDYAVLFLDLDNFKMINDEFGHSAGDLALIELGQRLGKCIRAVDTLARFGGDEFVILLENTESKNVTLSVANRILSELQRPFLHNDTKVAVTCSIGIVNSIKNYRNSEEVLHDVDIAMYTAKKAGKARFEIFNIEMGTAATYQLEVEGELHRAITNKELFLHYQPIINLTTNTIYGFEALLRWQHPLRGLLEPDDFIPIAEDSGAINPIGDWVIKNACEQMKKWHADYPERSDLFISINISGKQILKSSLMEILQRTLKEIDFDPHKLIFEITESTLVLNHSLVTEQLAALRKIGVSIALDDFGTGYSSLYNLNNITVDQIKIDNVFTEGIAEGKKNYEINKSIIQMTKRLGIETVIEGIEESSQLEAFASLGCDYGQGYFLAKPMIASEIEQRIFCGHNQTYSFL